MNIRNIIEEILVVLNVLLYVAIKFAAFVHEIILKIFSIILVIFVTPHDSIMDCQHASADVGIENHSSWDNPVSVIFASMVGLRMLNKEKFSHFMKSMHRMKINPHVYADFLRYSQR